MTEPTMTQADKDLLKEVWHKSFLASIRGETIDDEFLRMFAAHREAAYAAGIAAGKLAGAKAMQERAAVRGRLAQLENKLVDVEIRALDPAQIAKG